jgi:5-carboxymethyl-2-hydroxymuconate isomerase
MPHFIVEYSANLESKVDIGALCDQIADTALATGLFEIGAIRVRAVRCEHYAIADRLPENSFVDVRLRMGEGRNERDRRRAGETIFEALETFLEPLYETPHFALSFSIAEIDSRFSWKKNGIHPRLRKMET